MQNIPIPSGASQVQTFRLIVVNRESEVAVLHGHGNPSLPEVAIPLFARTVQAVTRECRDRFGVRLFVMFAGKRRPFCTSFMVARLQQECELPNGFSWRDPDTLSPALSAECALTLREALDEYSQYNSGAIPSNFARYGALDDLRAWYEPILRFGNLTEIAIEQHNGDAFFALFRITAQSDCGNAHKTHLWVKAVGDPNVREFAVSRTIAKEFPYNSPTVLAEKPEWNAWLMEAVEGYELDVQLDGRPWGKAGSHFATIQTQFIDREDELISIGCKDWRVPEVIMRLEPLFEHMVEAMGRQSKSPPARLTRQELRDMAVKCRDLCWRVEDLAIPDTLAHGDFSPHNILIRWGWPIYIDWAESYLTFPFVTWEYYKNRLLKDHPEHAHWLPRMQKLYERQWLGILGSARIARAMELVPPYAVLISALYCSTGDVCKGIPEAMEPMKRALVRRLQRELNDIGTTIAAI